MSASRGIAYGNIRIEDFGNEQIAVAKNGEMILKGRLESVEGECAVIRFKNSIIMFVAEGNPFPVGPMIKIMAKNITLYPY